MDITAQEFVQQIQSVTEEIRLMTASMYEGNIGNGFGKLPGIIDRIGFAADQYVQIHGNTEKVVRLNKELSNINDVIANNDFILFADIFEYEIILILEEMLKDLQEKYTN